MAPSSPQRLQWMFKASETLREKQNSVKSKTKSEKKLLRISISKKLRLNISIGTRKEAVFFQQCSSFRAEN